MLYLLLIIFFSLGYLAIIFESWLHINKAAVALFMGAFCWLIFFFYQPNHHFQEFVQHLADVAQIIFFLLAAMIIVELIDSHHGFKIITDMLYLSSQRRLLWFLITIAFFMSAVLDNLTAMIVMASLLKRLVHQKQSRWFIGSILVIAVNAGGAWTPIGDVTTTMLWINDKITTAMTLKSLFLPSLICTVVSGLIASRFVRGSVEALPITISLQMAPGAKRVFFMGTGSLIMIPIWKAFFGLPPFMGGLLGLGILWLVTDLIHHQHGEERWHLRVTHVLTKIDTSGILFFLGILLAVSALNSAGILRDFAHWLHEMIPNQAWVVVIIGLISSIIDNVPLVAATMGMYDMSMYPTDSSLWQMIAYAAGTGGSILIIGSAAGVAFMGIEKIDFIWYLKRIAWIALIGYSAGFFAYIIL